MGGDPYFSHLSSPPPPGLPILTLQSPNFIFFFNDKFIICICPLFFYKEIQKSYENKNSSSSCYNPIRRNPRFITIYNNIRSSIPRFHSSNG